MPLHWEVAMATTDDGGSKVVQKRQWKKTKKKTMGGWGSGGGAGVNQVKIRCHKTLTAERGELILTDRVCESKCP